jgi:hypothetical protein
MREGEPEERRIAKRVSEDGFQRVHVSH